MRRPVIGLGLALCLAACQEGVDTGTASQELTDCLPTGLYAGQVNTPLPPVKAWSGALPSAPAGGLIITARDAQGNFVAFGVDINNATVPWARLVPAGKLEGFFTAANLAGVPVVDRPLPQPYPPRTDAFLEVGYRAREGIGNGIAVSQSYQPW